MSWICITMVICNISNWIITLSDTFALWFFHTSKVKNKFPFLLQDKLESCIFVPSHRYIVWEGHKSLRKELKLFLFFYCLFYWLVSMQGNTVVWYVHYDCMICQLRFISDCLVSLDPFCVCYNTSVASVGLCFLEEQSYYLIFDMKYYYLIAWCSLGRYLLLANKTIIPIL